MKEKNVKKAFTLIELSIVILIISVLISGGLQFSMNAINNAKIKITKDRMGEIYKALGSFLLVNKMLPCPASITDLKSSSTYGNAGSCSTTNDSGVYVSTNTSALNLNYGMVPIKALGLSSEMAEDGFGNKFAYVVDRRFAVESGYSSNAYGSINIKENQGGGDQTVIPVTGATFSDGGIFVIISYGQNQLGAFPANSSIKNSCSSDTKEQDNDLSDTTSPNFDNNFFSIAKNSDSFDDIVFYKSRNLFLLDFNALSLIKCAPTSTNHGDVGNCNGGGTCVWPEAYYNQIVTSTSTCSTTHNKTVTYPTKKCGAFGAWQAGAINPCTQ